MYSMSCHLFAVAAQSVFEADTSQRQKALQDFDLQAVDVVGWEGYDDDDGREVHFLRRP